MLRAAIFLQKAMEAEAAAQEAASSVERTHHARVAQSWRRMAEDVYRDFAQPAERLAA